MKENIIYIVLKQFWRMIMASFVIYLANILLILAIIFLPFKIITSPIYIVLVIMVFPSLSAAMELLTNNPDEINFIVGFKEFLNRYRANFKNMIGIGAIYTVIIGFLVIDIFSANSVMKMPMIIPLLWVLLMITIVHLTWMIAVQSKFVVTIRNGMKIVNFSMTKFAIQSLLLIALYFLAYMSLQFIPQYIVLVLVPLMLVGVKKITEKPMKKIESKVIIQAS